MSNVLILGATSDIAQSLAATYALKKCSLTLAGIPYEQLQTIQSDLQIRFDADIAISKFDALDFSSHKSFYSALNQIPDIVVVIFGYLGDQEKAQKDWDEARRILDTNFSGAVSILNIVAQSFQEKGSGVIVGVSSVAGDRGRQSNYFYGSAKAGFTAYLSGLRNRLCKYGIHVMTVKPGFVNTSMTAGLDLPKPLTAEPDQIARAIMKGIKRRKNNIYYLPIWRIIMLIIKLIPEGIFKKLKL